jgi:hypothetical protein
MYSGRQDQQDTHGIDCKEVVPSRPCRSWSSVVGADNVLQGQATMIVSSRASAEIRSHVLSWLILACSQHSVDRIDDMHSRVLALE